MLIRSEVVLEIRRYRRNLVGEFMDANPAVFGTPATASRWVDFVVKEQSIECSDQLSLEKAVRMFSLMFRQAQHAMQTIVPVRLDEFFSVENFPEVEGVVEPDPVALLVISGGDAGNYSIEEFAFARVVTVFKYLVHSGSVTAEWMYERVCQGLDAVPSFSPVQRSLVEALKQVVQRDMEIMLRSERLKLSN
jgi:hypothetical protein